MRRNGDGRGVISGSWRGVELCAMKDGCGKRRGRRRTSGDEVTDRGTTGRTFFEGLT